MTVNIKNASTYVKLQDAYVSESNKVGSWTKIGYVAPGGTSAGAASTTNFSYIPGSADDAALGGEGGYSAAKEWAAANIVALNDCAAQASNVAIASANWSITVTPATNGNSVTYTAATNCSQLTPTFDKIGGGSGT